MPKISKELRKADRLPLAAQEELLEQLKWQSWSRGNLSYLCRPNAQLSMYRRIHEQPDRFPGQAEPLFGLCHRQLGKSHLGLLLLVEDGIKDPGVTLNFGTDTVDRAQEIVDEKLPVITIDCPPWIKIWTSGRTVFIRNRHWAKGVISKIRLRGLDYRRGDRMRGGNTSYVVIDEAGYISYLEYSIRHVVTPMFRGQKRPRLLILTTPPENPQDHDSYKYYLRAKKSDSLMFWPAEKNPDWTAEDDKLMLGEYGTKKNIAWRRELGCEMIADRERLAVPEWPDSLGEHYVEVLEHDPKTEPAPGTVQKPAFYRGYVTIDAGWKDFMAAVLSLYDFDNRRIIVLAEIFVNYTPTRVFSELLRDAIDATYPKEYHEDLDIRSESSALTLADLNDALYDKEQYYQYFVSEVNKWDSEAGLNTFRTGVQLGRVLVSHECVQLNDTLSIGMLNKRRTDFERTRALGHCDLLAALNYQYKHINWDENPRTPEQKRPSSTEQFNPYLQEEEESDSIEAIQAIFNTTDGRGPGRRK